MTAKMKMMMQRTKVRLPRAPIVFPMMEMRRLRVGQDLASLNTLSCNFDINKYKNKKNEI